MNTEWNSRNVITEHRIPSYNAIEDRYCPLTIHRKYNARQKEKAQEEANVRFAKIHIEKESLEDGEKMQHTWFGEDVNSQKHKRNITYQNEMKQVQGLIEMDLIRKIVLRETHLSQFKDYAKGKKRPWKAIQQCVYAYRLLTIEIIEQIVKWRLELVGLY